MDGLRKMKEGRLSLDNFFKDILASVRMSRRRGFLSGLMTVWGVFIFIAVVGTSNGIDRGNRSNYDYILGYILISVSPGETSMAYDGLVKGHRVSLTRSDAQELQTLFSDRSEFVYPRKQNLVKCESLTGTAGAVVSDYRKELNDNVLQIIAGRNFTQVELDGRSRNCIIPENMAVQLFGKSDDAVNRTIQVDGLPYLVLGVYKTLHNVSINYVFVPFETSMSMQGMEDELSSIDIKLILDTSVEEKYRLKEDIRSWLYFKKGICPDDASALHFEESIDFIDAQENLLDSIRLFTVILGLLSLLMGILGVSSIVYLSVKERTKEIAVRLVCGSGKGSIFRLILGEAVFIMLIFGCIGMLLGSAALKVANIVVEKFTADEKWIFIGNMTVSWQLILSCTALVIVCGLVSGLAPARKATSVRINQAMECE